MIAAAIARTPTSWAAGLGAATCLAIVLTLGRLQLLDLASAQQEFVTAVGEQRSIGLSDGSIVHMNTLSNVQVVYSATARDIYLNQGQAIFKVSRDPARPFRVHVSSTIIQAVGTIFDVHRFQDRTNVAVVEGVVQIIPRGAAGSMDQEALSKLPPNTRVTAGETVVIGDDGKLSTREPISATAGQRRRLIFRNHRLEEIADEFNRYNRSPQIRVDGEHLRKRRFTVVLDADDPQSLLDCLSTDKTIAIDRRGDEIVIRMSPGLAGRAPAP